MADDREPGRRKRLRVGHVSERSAINAVRTLFERHLLVVDEVDGRSDYGRDLIVDITEGDEITGAVIGVQIKGDRRFVREGDWALPVTPKDRRYWAESSVPIFGILWDPDTEELRWSNLTEHARTTPTSTGSDDAIRFAPSCCLTDDTLPELLDDARDFLRRWSPAALLGLFDGDDEWRCNAVFDCWTLGRSDARAFILLRRALPSLDGASLRQAIVVLSHLTPHPDIVWHSDNWIPEYIKADVRLTFRWSASELFDLVSAVEHRPEAIRGWERGGLGQCLWSLLIQDADLHRKVLPAIGLALDVDDLDAAFRLLVIAQSGVEDPLASAKEAVAQYPRLGEHFYTAELLEQIEEFGFVDVY